MSIVQTSIFDAPPTLGTHRKADRPTSVAAARSVQPGPDQQRCLEAFINGTATIDSVCEHFEVLGIRRDRGSLSRRLTDLADAGFIRDSGEVVRGSRSRDVTVWRLA